MFWELIAPFVANKDSFLTLNNANNSVSFRETTHFIKDKLILALTSLF